MLVRALISLAASKPDLDGKHRRCIRIWDVRKAFFNSDLNELIYVHPGRELCERGKCWKLNKAMNGTRLASQLWGENIKATVDDAGGRSLKGTPGMFYFKQLVHETKDAMSQRRIWPP